MSRLGDESRLFVDITVEDRAHSAGAPLPSPFRIFDEIYEFRTNPRGRVNVLLSLDRHPDDGHAAAGQPGDFPLAWYRLYGSGRTFYTALGIETMCGTIGGSSNTCWVLSGGRSGAAEGDAGSLYDSDLRSSCDSRALARSWGRRRSPPLLSLVGGKLPYKRRCCN